MNLLYRLFRQDPQSREGIITVTSGLGIAVNLLIALLKIVAGLLASSIAIVSEGVNNAVDALTSLLTLVGTKLAGKHPDEKHPFGYGRIEYLTSLVVSILITVTGVEILTSSIELIRHPEELSISRLSMAIVAVAAVVKFLLGAYTIRMGKKAGSKALEAVGLEGRNDSFVSVLTLISSAIFLFTGLSVDAWVGVCVALLILRTGLGVLRETVSELLGRPGQKELADQIYEILRGTDGVLGAADMMLHNYGPERWSGSVNLEIDHRRSIGDIYRDLHRVQLEIMHRYHTVMVFGIYAVDEDSEEGCALRGEVSAFVESREHLQSYHALYLDRENSTLYLDFVVDYELRDWKGLRRDFAAYMAERHPELSVELVVETEYV